MMFNEAVRQILCYDLIMTNNETEYWYYRNITNDGKIRILKAKPDPYHPERSANKRRYSGFSQFFVNERELTATWYEYQKEDQ